MRKIEKEGLLFDINQLKDRLEKKGLNTKEYPNYTMKDKSDDIFNLFISLQNKASEI